jgi:hypothetical protein
MSNLKAAVSAYFQREAKANKPGGKGADVAEILEQVAVEYSVETDVLTEAMLDASAMGVS